MSEGISAPFIRYPIGTSLMMAGILFVGLVAYPLLPVAPLPQVDFPTIQVAASLPGGSPETMASSVAQPLERQLAQIPGVAQMTSTSSLGSTAITIQFDLNRSIDGAANDIQAAINAAGGQLPKSLPFEFRSIPRSWWSRACRWKTSAIRSRSRQLTVRRETSTATPVATRSMRMISFRNPKTGTTSSLPIATADRCGSATSVRPSRGPKTLSKPPGPTENVAYSLLSSSSRAPTSSTPSTRSRHSCQG